MMETVMLTMHLDRGLAPILPFRLLLLGNGSAGYVGEHVIVGAFYLRDTRPGESLQTPRPP